MANALKTVLTQRLRWLFMFIPYFCFGILPHGEIKVTSGGRGLFHLQVRWPQGRASRQRDGIKEGDGQENPRSLGTSLSPSLGVGWTLI